MGKFTAPLQNSIFGENLKWSVFTYFSTTCKKSLFPKPAKDMDKALEYQSLLLLSFEDLFAWNGMKIGNWLMFIGSEALKCIAILQVLKRCFDLTFTSVQHSLRVYEVNALCYSQRNLAFFLTNFFFCGKLFLENEVRFYLWKIFMKLILKLIMKKKY